MRIRTIEKLSEHREFTPEGYLLCKGAALARTGVLRYLKNEVDPDLMKGSDSDEALLYRDEAEVFDPRAMASFEGKPLTLDHPDCDVNPDNWRDLGRGIVLNVRRGSGAESDLLLADILVTDAEAIGLIKNGLRELSCGYDTKLEIIRPGIGRQTQIRGNHVALVDRGRAGARCSIKDTEETMAKKPSLFDKMKKLLKDEEEELEAKSETPLPANDEDNLLAELQEIKLMLRTLIEALPKKDDDPAKEENQPAQDEQEAASDEESESDEESASDEEQTDEESCQKDSLPGRFCDARTAALAKRLGLSGARIGDSARAVMTGALSIAMRDSQTFDICRDILGDTPLQKASLANVRAAFMAVSAVKGKSSNSRTADALTVPGGKKSGPITPAAINKLNSEFYGGK